MPDVPLPPDDLTVEFDIIVTPLNNAMFSYHWHANIKGADDVRDWSASGIELSEHKAEVRAKQACEQKAHQIKHQLGRKTQLGYKVTV